MTTKLNELKKQQKELQDKIASEYNDFFKKHCAELFEEFPEMQSFSWNEYTPYFNDGDTCEFNANTDYPEINGNESCDYDANFRDGKPNPDANPRLAKAGCAVAKFLQQFDNAFFLGAFGDHMKVTVTRDDVKTEDYDHE